MGYEIVGFDPEASMAEAERYEKPVGVEVWYEREWRSWGAAYVNADGDHIGESRWSHRKADALVDKARMLREMEGSNG